MVSLAGAGSFQFRFRDTLEKTTMDGAKTIAALSTA